MVQLRRRGGGLRGYAIPKSTLAAARRRFDAIEPDPQARAFFDGERGQSMLHGLVTALLLVLVFRRGLGVAVVRETLRACSLDTRVACSDAYLRQRVSVMRNKILQFEKEQTDALVAHASTRQIVLAPDEIFRCGRMILTAPDPVSGMVLVHAVAAQRDGVTWDSAVRQGLERAHVTLVALCADGASGIHNAAVERLQVRLDPDLFHATKGLTEALGRTLRAALPVAMRARAKAASKALQERVTSAGGHPSSSAVSIAQVKAQDALVAAQRTVHQIETEQKALGQVCQTVSLALHAVDLHSGRMRDPDEFATIAEDQLRRLDPIAERLGRKSQNAVAAVRAMIPAWVLMLVSWQTRVRERLASEVMSANLRGVMWGLLIPACYLGWVSGRNQVPTAMRKYLRDLRDELLTMVASDAEWSSLPRDLRVHWEGVAQECARWFVRASSCTEGHNQWTALRLHRHHGVQGEWLSALKVVHNFLLRRPDGTTAAQRFYGAPHADLFEYLRDRMPPLAFPRKRSPKKRPDPLRLAA